MDISNPPSRKSYPSDVSDEVCPFAAPYLTLMTDACRSWRICPLRAAFNGMDYIVRTGAAWRTMPNDLPRWEMVFRQTQRWIEACVFETMVHDLRALLRLAEGRNEQSSAAIFDSSTLLSASESGGPPPLESHAAWVLLQ
jgi:transposase